MGQDDDGEFLRWMRDTQGQQAVKLSDALREALADVELDVPDRRLAFPDGEVRSFQESVAHLQGLHPDSLPEEISNLLLDWMEGYEPGDVFLDEADSAELQALLSEWIEDIERGAADPA